MPAKINKIKLQERMNSPGHTVFQMIVPRWLCNALHWKKGTALVVSKRGRFMRVCKEEDGK